MSVQVLVGTLLLFLCTSARATCTLILPAGIIIPDSTSSNYPHHKQAAMKGAAFMDGSVGRPSGTAKRKRLAAIETSARRAVSKQSTVRDSTSDVPPASFVLSASSVMRSSS